MGLPLALLTSTKGFDVIGIDINEQAVKELQNGQTHLEDASIQDQLNNTSVKFSNDFEAVKNADIVIDAYQHQLTTIRCLILTP